MCKLFAGFDVYELDMWSDGEGGWQENSRLHIGEIRVPLNAGGDVTDKSILKALKELEVYDMIGRSVKCLKTTSRSVVYIDDLYGDGSWFEVGSAKDRQPVYGLERTFDCVA